MKKTCSYALASAITSILSIASHANAAVFNVTRATDDGTGNTTGTLSHAIYQANQVSGTDTITLKTDVTITGVMKRLINSDITLKSDYFRRSISGDNKYRPLFIRSGNVIINNLDIKNGKAQGGFGGNGGGGGAGLGGGLFICGSPACEVPFGQTVILKDVAFIDNQAVGGDANASGFGGGGGMFGNAYFGGGGGLFAHSTSNDGAYAGTGFYGGDPSKGKAGVDGVVGLNGTVSGGYDGFPGGYGEQGDFNYFGGGGGRAGNGGKGGNRWPSHPDNTGGVGGPGGWGGWGGWGGGGGRGGNGAGMGANGGRDAFGNILYSISHGNPGGGGGFGGGGGGAGIGGASHGAQGSKGGFGGGGGNSGSGSHLPGNPGTSEYGGGTSGTGDGALGGGGAGFGGAIFAIGNIRLYDVSFSGNSVTGGQGANPGSAKSKDVFICNIDVNGAGACFATVSSCGNNNASTSDLPTGTSFSDYCPEPPLVESDSPTIITPVLDYLMSEDILD